MNNSKVSIITPLYNSGKYLSETVRSVIEQSYSDWEMIIVDDCSTDDSYNIAANLAAKDHRITVLRLGSNAGAAVARNTAIDYSTGRYIAFIDSDDLWDNNKLTIQIKFMQDNNYYFTFTGYRLIDDCGKPTGVVRKALKEVKYKRALLSNHIGCSTVIYDAGIIGKVQMPLIKKRQDYGLWLRILKTGITGYGLDTVMASYRLRIGSISSNKLTLIKYQWDLYRKIEGFCFLKAVFYTSTSVLFRILRK